MAKRTPKQQTKHYKEVKNQAQYYKRQGIKVEADIEDFDKPKTINGRRPDIIAKKGKKVIIVEIETSESLKKDEGQQKVFKNYADKHKNVRFRTKLAK